MSGFEIELPSSPDPLGDESIIIPPGSAAPPPPSTTRRPFQSAASSRFSAIPGTSPRKRMFALDVGNEITPQTIYVTVEAGPDGNPITKPGNASSVGGPNVRRLLFGSPTPQPSPRRGRPRTTTTTVPLRGLTDDEGDPTPRRRRRSSNRPGTPATAGAKRKKKGTPTPSRPRGRPRGTPVASSDALQSEAPATVEKPTPRRGRPPKRKAEESAPSDQGSHAPPEASATKKPGRKRQKSIQADDTDELTIAGIDIAPPQSYNRHSSPPTDDTNQQISLEEANEDGGAAQQEEAEEEEDPFLAQLSDPPRDAYPSSTAEQPADSFEPFDEGQFEQQHPGLEDEGPLPDQSDDYAPMMDFDDRSDVGSHHDGPPTPNALEEHASMELEDQGPLPGESDDYAPMMDRDDESDVQSHHSEATPRASRNDRQEPLELEDQGPLPGESDDHAPMMDIDDGSDAESHHSFRLARSEDATDHTVDPDTFTMIGIETMPSFQGNRGAPTSDPPEIGETTSLLINKTLESLRQEMDLTDEENDDIDLLGSRQQTPVRAPAQSAHKVSSGRKPSAPKSSHTQELRTRQASGASQPSRGSNAPEHTALEALQEYTQSPSPPIQEKDNNHVTGVSSDELNADDDSFSDIPEEVFAAVEPQEVARPASPSEDELTMGVVPAQKWAPDSIPSQETIPVDSQGSEIAENPQDARERPEPSHADEDGFLQSSASHSIQSGRRSSQSAQKGSQPHPTRSRSDSNRLLTPPDEPTSSSEHSIPATNQPNEEQKVFVDGDDEIGSSPPEITTFDRKEEQPMQDSRRSSDTPTNRPPSIHLQPVQPREANAAIFPSQTAGSRPFLSPIVRVGERLQNILSDPPSPSARSSVLGSPFKGSVRKSSLDAPSDEEAQHGDTSSNTTLQNPPAAPASPKPTWTQSLFSLSHLKSLVTEGTKRISSPQVNVTQTWEDPFGPSSPSKDRGASGRNSAFMERIRQASREGSVHSSRTSVARATLGEVDDRSLSGDPAPRGLSSSWRGGRSHQPGLLGAEVVPGQCHVGRLIGSDGAADEEPEATAADHLQEDPQTDDTLLQPVEDQALESKSIRYPQLHDEVVQEEQTQTQSREDAMQIDEAPLDGDGSDDDIWAIEADRTASSPTAQKRANESINESFNAFARSGLSIDWGTRSTISQNLPPGRSPAFKQSMRGGSQPMHENLEDYSLLDLHSGTDTQPSAKKPTPEQQQRPKRADLSDFFSSSPNFIERERRARTALRARSVAQNSTESHAPQISWPASLHNTQDDYNAPQTQPSSDGQFSEELPTPARATDQPFGQDAMGHLSSESTPERPRLPQHRLAPRRSHNDAALFENWEVSSSRAPTERLHVSDPISDAQPSSPEAIERPSTPEDPGESSFEAPALKPLPGRAMSPSKSCLRSPLKPKTPGRVVEFTSSTLSPMAQGQARAGPQGKNPTTTLGRPPTLSPRRSPRGKENEPSALKSYIHSSPHHRHLGTTPNRQQEEPAESPLSQTKWSKRHWLLMDGLLQAYRRSALDFQLRHSDAVMASPKKRASSSLLGKMVTSQGERMALEQWHLDIVDAFKKEVGGWPEDALAKRLFSLIVGEERRRSGLVPKRR